MAGRILVVEDDRTLRTDHRSHRHHRFFALILPYHADKSGAKGNGLE